MEGTIHPFNTPHHQVKYLFKVSTVALHIPLSVSILRRGDIMRISAQNPRDTGRQITQDKNVAQIGRCLLQGSSGSAMSNNWLLLDSCYTVSCTKKNSIVSNVTVRPSEEHPHIYSNGVHMDYNMRGTLDILPMGIYVNDNSMENILSLKEVEYYFRVTMDTKENHTILFHCSEDKAYRFKECGKGLYYLDISNPEIITLTNDRGDTNYSFLYTMNAIMEYFTCT